MEEYWEPSSTVVPAASWPALQADVATAKTIRPTNVFMTFPSVRAAAITQSCFAERKRCDVLDGNRQVLDTNPSDGKSASFCAVTTHSLEVGFGKHTGSKNEPVFFHPCADDDTMNLQHPASIA